MESQLARYSAELSRIQEQLAADPSNPKLQQLHQKLSRIVELLESKKATVKKPRLAAAGIKEGDMIRVLVEGKWRDGCYVVESKAPYYILVNCPSIGRTVRVDDPKMIKTEPALSVSVKLPADLSAERTQTTVDRKQTTVKGVDERQQSWKAFTEKKRLKR
jgi:hypothetical protein